jgi:hypothetical protein
VTARTAWRIQQAVTEPAGGRDVCATMLGSGLQRLFGSAARCCSTRPGPSASALPRAAYCHYSVLRRSDSTAKPPEHHVGVAECSRSMENCGHVPISTSRTSAYLCAAEEYQLRAWTVDVFAEFEKPRPRDSRSREGSSPVRDRRVRRRRRGWPARRTGSARGGARWGLGHGACEGEDRRRRR